ncbi:MAG: diacylglycerol kinase family protein [Lachnospiraceae bacterium]|nr:diacylglycerol kinase family protein [Ruminococcus sp.]MCM1276070.1 diacylglycerol kinase family protein [Lachnospiraceae bacterium]
MKFFKSFYYAGRGIVTALGQRNFRFHLCAAAFVIYFAARFYSFSAERWALLVLTCALVTALETVNTGIEKLADKVTEENSHRIKLAKDCAAGAVLISAIGAAAVGVLLFWNTDVLGLIFLYFTEPARLAALILALAAAWGFVFLPEYRKKDGK